jgi:hypothetical protein
MTYTTRIPERCSGSIKKCIKRLAILPTLKNRKERLAILPNLKNRELSFAVAVGIFINDTETYFKKSEMENPEILTPFEII